MGNLPLVSKDTSLQTGYNVQNHRITESQNHRMFGIGRDLCGSSSPTPLPKKGRLQQACRGRCPGRSWISPEKENPQPPWAACSSAPSPSEGRSSSSCSDGTCYASLCKITYQDSQWLGQKERLPFTLGNGIYLLEQRLPVCIGMNFTQTVFRIAACYTE